MAKLSTERPVGSATIPTVSGWRGVVASRIGRGDMSIGWECSHNHKFRDVAANCAGRAYRRWSRTGEKPE